MRIQDLYQLINAEDQRIQSAGVKLVASGETLISDAISAFTPAQIDLLDAILEKVYTLWIPPSLKDLNRSCSSAQSSSSPSRRRSRRLSVLWRPPSTSDLSLQARLETKI